MAETASPAPQAFILNECLFQRLFEARRACFLSPSNRKLPAQRLFDARSIFLLSPNDRKSSVQRPFDVRKARLLSPNNRKHPLQQSFQSKNHMFFPDANGRETPSSSPSKSGKHLFPC
ncbi:hypothetical protein [Bifidobacterium callitrichidarum]|uniref:hypothetical protein n=1 Tax=Bifidobacterium callitrichidarum TaxID=2052941 RepID=UPI0011B26685|nr:hypothetical protein [Bifidobacterium callitrichidarum]